jgi:hypothetical protein
MPLAAAFADLRLISSSGPATCVNSKHRKLVVQIKSEMCNRLYRWSSCTISKGSLPYRVACLSVDLNLIYLTHQIYPALKLRTSRFQHVYHDKGGLAVLGRSCLRRVIFDETYGKLMQFWKNARVNNITTMQGLGKPVWAAVLISLLKGLAALSLVLELGYLLPFCSKGAI